MGDAVQILGIQHHDSTQLESLLKYLNSIPNAEKGNFIFLLEYDPERYQNDRLAYRRRQRWPRYHAQDFYAIARALESRQIRYEFIDSKSLHYKERFLIRAGWRELLRLALHRRRGRHPEVLKQISPRFYEEFIVRREEDMSREIVKTERKQIYKNIIAIVGKDHVERLAGLIRRHVRDVKTATL